MKNKLLLIAACFVFSSGLFVPSSMRADDSASKAKTITTPKEFLGHDIGEDYFLANYKQFQGYLERIEKQTDLMKLVKIGKSEEGRDQLMAIVSSPANLAKLDHFRKISAKLAKGEISADEARKLSEEGKAVVWIDGGLHASEVLCAQALIEAIYQMVSGTDAETKRILDDVIVLFVHCNPDGMDLCADWYMRNEDPKKRSSQGLPRLYEKYAGHDNNRDFYAQLLQETKNMNRVMYREWFPQIVLNQHQSAAPGTVMFIPPCRDPFNYNIHPLVVNGVDRVSSAIIGRFLAEGKPGATVRTGAVYSTWFNGGLSTTAEFHNIIGLFSETIGSPTPSRIPYLPRKLLPSSDHIEPADPQEWHFRQSVDYAVSSNKAILDFASRNRETLLHDIWYMGKSEIDAGNRDSWSTTPKIVTAATGGIRGPAAAGGGGRGAGGGPGMGGGGGPGRGGGGRRGGGGNPADFAKFFHDAAKRDPRGYILPSDQPDFLTATKLVNTLIGNGLTIHRATAEFEIKGKKYPAGSYVIKSAQAFRSQLLDMMEPQDHPDDFAQGATTPTAPYDMAGWTLAYQMGVQFDRVLDSFNGPFEELKGEVPPPAAKVFDAKGAVGYYLDARMNDAFRAVNELLAAGETVKRLTKPCVLKRPSDLKSSLVTETFAPDNRGTFIVVKNQSTLARLEKIAAELGTPFYAITEAPPETETLRPVRVGLWDRYGGSMPSGWARLLMEKFKFPFEVVYAPQLDKGNLHDKYDVLLFVEGGVPGTGGGGGRGLGGGGGGGSGRGGEGGAGGDQPPPGPADQRGNVTVEKTVPELKKFLEDGGTIITIASSTGLANHLKLPLGNHIVAKDAEGKEKPLGRDKFFVPGSVVQIRLDPSSSLTWGMPEHIDVMYNSSPVFHLPDGKDAQGLKRVAWYDNKTPLRSGWAWGEEHLEGGVAIAEANVGKGRLILFGPQVLFRGQPDGAFKLVFNSIVEAGIKE